VKPCAASQVSGQDLDTGPGAAQALGLSGQPVFSAGHQDQVVALFGEQSGRGDADPAAGSGDGPVLVKVSPGDLSPRDTILVRAWGNPDYGALLDR
jgi:hypothetical protein